MAPTANNDSSLQTANPRSKYTFSQEWHEWLIPDWEAFTAPIRDEKLHILEIGSFEGASTTWMLDNLMSHPESTLTAVDTFEGSMEHQHEADPAHGAYKLSSLEARFRANVNRCEQVNKLHVIQSTSDEALIHLRQERAMFDLIYIDGSHIALDVLHDAVLCWRMLKTKGIMVFDDWSWKGYNEECYNPRPAIKSFLKCAAPELQCVETEAQMWVMKVLNHVPATRNGDADPLHEWANKDLPTTKVFGFPTDSLMS